ncbi:MAG: hypothetical protein J6A80_05110 [Lachnospiraceae bacterium]|nr:hypothetical protein [Lachnospiraceae bacterium]
MKLKYYLRGLGIGIAVTALVLALAGGGKESLTDEEIIARAKELGMVESVTLSQLGDDKTNEEVSEDTSEISSEDDSENITSEGEDASLVTSEEAEVSEEIGSENTEGTSDTETSEETDSEENTSESDSEVTSEANSETQTSEVIDEYVIVEVGAGDGSDTVSRKLEALGMVEDAMMYDDFLCANGYDKILQTGKHEIPRTADWDMIAEILAGRQ